MTEEFNKILPILEIDKDCIVSKLGDCTLVFELFKPELFTLSTEELDALHQRWVKAIGLLPYGVVLHVQDWWTRANWLVDFETTQDQSFLSRSSDRFFHERPYRVHRCYLFLTRRFGSKRPPTSALSSLLRRSNAPEYLLHPAQVQEWIDQCEQFIHVLTEGGKLQYRRLNADDLAGTEDQMGLLQQYHQLSAPFMRPELKDVGLYKNIWIGDHETVLYTLADAEQLSACCSPETNYDRYSSEGIPYPIGFATPIGALLDADHIYNQFILLDDPQPVLRKLETRRRRLKSLSMQARENEVTHQAIEAFLEVAAVDKRPVKAHFNIMAWADPEEMMRSVKNKITSAIIRMGAIPHLETIGAAQIWWAGQAGNAGDLPVNETFDTFAEQATCFLIPESNGRSSISPFGIRLGERQTGVPLHIDLSDEPMRSGKITNRNKFILGGSGSGKSFFTNHLVRSYYEQGAHIVLVDVGGSYKGLCELVGGYYFAYSEETPISFNPFWLGEANKPDTEKKESIKALLLVLWKKGGETFTRAEYVTISNAIDAYYAHLENNPDIFPCFDSWYEFLKEGFATELVRAMEEKNFDLYNFWHVLKPYYKGGTYDYLLNAREQVDLLQQRFLVFELDAIKDHEILFPVVTIVVMEIFIAKMRRLKGVRKVILLEEAWKAIAKEGMSEYVKYLFKTVRKHFGEAIVVTQDIEDIISSPVVKNTIINNADCKILLDQSKFRNRFDQIMALLGLTEKDKTMVLSLNKANEPGKKYKEVFISLGADHSRIYRTEVSLEEYLVYTTEQSERLKVDIYTARYGGIRKGVAALAADIRAGVVQLLFAVVFAGVFLLAPHRVSAQIEVVTEVIKEALEQADLKIQELQTQTVALQDAEKELENEMTGGLLVDITGWVQQEEDLYSAYYQELWRVKTALTDFSKVKTLLDKQVQLVKDYQLAWAAVRQDPHFSPEELVHIGNVYSGIFYESVRNTQQLTLAIKAFVTQMDDAGRLRVIDETADRIDRNYSDLHVYTEQNSLLSMQRAKDQQDIATIKTLYGIP